MDEQVKVVVLGNSLLMDSVGTNLRDGLALCVFQADASDTGYGEYLNSLAPELVVFELDVPRPCTILSLLKENSGIVFMSVDTKSSQVIVFHSDRYQIRDMDEFCELVRSKLEHRKHVREEAINQ